MTGRGALVRRLRERWLSEGWTEPGDRVLVACSGGLDSLVLLHLLRFPLRDLDLRLEVAHFDHGLRPESGAEARWLRGVAGAWRLPFHLDRAPEPPADEEEARRLRYAFLEGLRREREARRVLTAHQADDQVETVLFRILRGTGVEGIRGIPESREPGLLRPLLPFPRAELEAYARAARLRPRWDPTNVSTAYRRNLIRHRLLPLLEEVHPGARPALLRLARNAARTAEALDALLAPVLDDVVVSRSGEEVEMDRDRLLELPPAVRAAALRSLVRQLGEDLDETGTARAVSFITTGSSGGRLDLPGSLVLSRAFHRLRLGRRPGGEEVGGPAEGPAPLRISSPDAGEGEVVVGGERFLVRWGWDEAQGEHVEGFDPEALAFPLVVRGWSPGDRTGSPGGTKKLKKLFGELRVPREVRSRLPLLVDGRGEVLWIPGRHRSPAAPGGRRPWFIGVEHGEARDG